MNNMEQCDAVTTRGMQIFFIPMLLIIGGILASTLSTQLFSSAAYHKRQALSYRSLILPEINEANSTSELARNYIQSHWQTITIKPGDTLGKILDNLGLHQETLNHLISTNQVAKSLKSLKPRQKLRILTNTEHQLEQLVYPLSLTRSLTVWRRGDRYVSRIVEHQLDTRVKYATGVIRGSLFADGEKVGLSQNTIVELAAIFGWDIDFAKDLRFGDRFSVIYEDQYHDGERVAGGRILAAEFTNDGHIYRAIRYTTPNGESNYYTPNGNSMRKAFLRTPVKFTRISSLFSRARYHPILYTLRAHKGVDYAAPHGTPVKATGDGRIVFRGQKSGYGNVVIVQHAGNYSTLYGHMSRFARVPQGGRIKQGDTIGYVGMTGMATGPHLHYEFHVNGQHRDPLKIKFAYADPISSKYRSDFKVKAVQLIEKLESLRHGTIGNANTGSEMA